MTPDLWGLSSDSENHLQVGGCDLVDLAHKHGTPLHVVNEDKLHGNFRRFKKSFAELIPEVKCYYSYKTNCVPGVLKKLHGDGCGAEIVSTYELWLALQLGVNPGDIVYNGVAKTREDLENAIGAGVGVINVDSLNEARLLRDVLSTTGHPVNVGIRVYPETGWRGQFGIQPDTEHLMEVCRLLASHANCRITCLHAHFGSGLTSTADYETVAESLTLLAHQIQDMLGIPIRYINLGGGFGVPTVKTLSIPEVALYKLLGFPPRAPDIHACPTFDDFASAIGNALRAARSDNSHAFGLMLEPGRVITSDAQLLLVTVRDIKNTTNGRNYAITDGGMQNIAYPLSYEYHHCFVANRITTPATRRYYVTGPLCSPEDILYRNWRLPELSIGDVLVIMDSGAYFTSFANNFSFPRPAVVMVSKGNASVVRARESFEQMIATDTCLDPER